jgi:lipoprotein-anchoring transpeptidase ErfK/SrfK
VSLGGGVEGKEIVVNGNIVVPPYGTTARRYVGVLGTRRLELGDGYGIHGTDHPESIGRSVSHGCVRMRNEDIERLYPMVGIGTPVYIY